MADSGSGYSEFGELSCNNKNKTSFATCRITQVSRCDTGQKPLRLASPPFMADPSMEVGILCDLNLNDQEGYIFVKKDFDAMNEFLKKNNYTPHIEPESLPEFENRCELNGYPYSFLHYLRNGYAHRKSDPTWMAKENIYDYEPDNDPVVEYEMDKMESHLLCHSDTGGYYLPVEFDSILYDEILIPDFFLGSSFKLMRELIEVAPALNIEVVDNDIQQTIIDSINHDMDSQNGIWIHRIVWFSLFEAARLSIKYRTAISFC